jgi:hypothetical protein
MVILNKGDVFTNGLIKCPAIKAVEEETPIVPVDTGLDHEHIGYSKRDGFHA